MTNNRICLYISFSLFFSGCASKQETCIKNFVTEVVTSNKHTIDDVFIRNRAITVQYMDSVLKNKPCEFYDTSFYTFSKGYKIVGIKGKFIPTIYHKYIRNGSNYMDILISNAQSNRFVRFVFRNINRNWLLMDIIFNGIP
jgi:hypothetical protein